MWMWTEKKRNKEDSREGKEEVDLALKNEEEKENRKEDEKSPNKQKRTKTWNNDKINENNWRI